MFYVNNKTGSLLKFDIINSPYTGVISKEMAKLAMKNTKREFKDKFS